MTSVRRSFLLTLTTALGLFALFSITKGPNPMASVAPFAKPREKWTAEHFFNFLNALPPKLKGRANLRKTASLIGQLQALKIEALVAAGMPKQEVFNASTAAMKTLSFCGFLQQCLPTLFQLTAFGGG